MPLEELQRRWEETLRTAQAAADLELDARVSAALYERVPYTPGEPYTVPDWEDKWLFRSYVFEPAGFALTVTLPREDCPEIYATEDARKRIAEELARRKAVSRAR
jgi:hypothetical protein